MKEASWIRYKRREGRRFALQHNLPITAELIRDKGNYLRNSCYGNIFETAIKELAPRSEREGFRRLTRLLVKSRNVEWMSQFWVRVHGSRMQHFTLGFRCEIWSRLAWGMLKFSCQYDLSRHCDLKLIDLNKKTLAKSILGNLDNPFAPSSLFDQGYLSQNLLTKLRSAAA